MKIKVKLNTASIDNAIKQLDEYQKRVERAGEYIAKHLADIGYEVAYGVISGHVWSGETAESLEVVQEGNRYILRAASKAILFFEFGAGATYGYGHPMAGEFGMGPGTYPDGKGHWNDPNGWWFPTDDPRLIRRTDSKGQGWGHSYGNAPHMPFYLADREIRDNILKVAKEALQS